jgi:hypothetical protein
MAEGFRIATAYVQVSPDTDGFKEELEEKLEEATAGVEAKVKIGADTDDLDAKVSEAKGKVDDLSGKTARPRADLDDADLTGKVDDAKAKLDDLDSKTARPRADLDDGDLRTKADDANAKLDDLDSRSARPRLDLEDADFDAKMDAAEARLAAFNSQSASANLGGSGGGSGGGGGAGEGGGGEGGSLLGLAAIGGGMLMPGLAGAATGMGLLAGVGGLAFGGIGKALSAAHQASENVGLTGAQMASTQFSNSVAVQQAQQSIGVAHEQAAQDAITSAQSIEQAEMNLASVERNAAASQVQALQSVTQAQQGVQQANYGLSEAQYNLTQAWVTARETIVQLNDQLADSNISVQAAQLAIQQATYNQMLVDQNAYSTSINRAQAALAIVQAQQQLKDAQDQATDAQTAANLANKQGVAGSQEVIQAKQAVTAAQYAQTDSQMQYADAQRNLTNTELNNAAQVKEAQMQVSAAQEQAAYTQMRDAQNVSIAQLNLTNTLKEQQLQWAATLSTSNQAANEFQKYMGRLTPAGRAFVNQILGMKGAFRALEDAAQTAVLPGFTVWLDGIAKLLPTVDQGVSRMGNAMSSAFGAFGKQMQTPAFAHVLDGLISNGIQFANIVLPAFAQFIQELARIGSAPGAVTGLANLLAGFAHGLTGLAAGLAPYTKQINQFLTAAGHVIAAIGPPLGRMIGLIAQVLTPLTHILSAHPNGALAKAIGDVLAGLIAIKGLQKVLPDFIAKPLAELAKTGAGKLLSPFTAAGKALPGVVKETFGPALSSAGQAISGFASSAAGTIAGFGSKFGSTMANAGSSVGAFVVDYAFRIRDAMIATGAWIAEHAVATAAFIAQNIAEAASATAAFVAENLATLGIAAGIALLVAGIVLLATHWKQVFTDVKNWTLDVWHNVLDPFFQTVGTLALDFYREQIYPMWQGIDTAFHAIATVVTWLWDDVLAPWISDTREGFTQLVSDLGRIWGGMESVFKTPVNFLISTVYDDGILKLWNDVVGAIGLGSLKLPKISPLAAGGVIPGYSPGHDTVPAMLSPGESVLTPQATKAIGPGTVHALNKQYPPNSSTGSQGSSPGSQGSSGGHLGKMVTREVRRHAMRLGEHAAGFSGGGVLGDIGSAVTGLGHAIMSGAKFTAEFATDPAKAVSDLLSGAVGTNATGDLGKVMTGIPAAMVKDIGHAVMNAIGGGTGKLPGGGSSAVGGLPENWKTIASYLAANGFTKFAAAGVAGNIDAESSGNPEQLEIGGGGGGGLIQWTPYPPGYITGDVQADLMTQLQAILSWGGGPSLVNRATSPSNAALLYQDYYEKPANLSATLPQRMSSANAVYRAMGWGSFDSGGWLMPGMGPVNQLTQPEAVLTPQQSQALIELASSARRGGDGATAQPQVVQNFIGTQLPTPEQQAQMRRDLAMSLSGV